MKTKPLIPSVNFHLWEPCNMKCKFCFATFQDVKKSILPKGHLKKSEAIDVVERLADYGFQKITFAGGEPTLCPWLQELVIIAKQRGMTTMIVTNGTIINQEYLKSFNGHLNWIALSIDTVNPIINLESGRTRPGKGVLTEVDYLRISEEIKITGIGLKVNTVVNRLNINENVSEFIRRIKPKRWKVLQVLPIKGQNDFQVDELRITEAEFWNYVKRNHEVIGDTYLIPEANFAMTGTYAMVDPAGRFFDNVNRQYKYSEQIHVVGVEVALNQVKIDSIGFQNRGGLYNW